MKNFKDYVDLYIKEKVDDAGQPLKIVYEQVSERWEIAVTISDQGFQQASFVNSIATTKVSFNDISIQTYFQLSNWCVFFFAFIYYLEIFQLNLSFFFFFFFQGWTPCWSCCWSFGKQNNWNCEKEKQRWSEYKAFPSK